MDFYFESQAVTSPPCMYSRLILADLSLTIAYQTAKLSNSVYCQNDIWYIV